MRADFTELNDFSLRLDAAADGIIRRAPIAIRKTAHDIVATAQTFVPVDTAATRNSIFAEFSNDGLTADVGPTTHYAPFVEYGTIQHPPQAFMGPSLDRHAPDLAKALGQIGSDL